MEYWKEGKQMEKSGAELLTAYSEGLHAGLGKNCKTYPPINLQRSCENVVLKYDTILRKDGQKLALKHNGMPSNLHTTYK